jgi:hypothetical protein
VEGQEGIGFGHCPAFIHSPARAAKAG